MEPRKTIRELQVDAAENHRRAVIWAEKVYQKKLAEGLKPKRLKVPKPEPCMTCDNIAKCKYESLVCSEFRSFASYTNYENPTRIPDMTWDEYQAQEIEYEEREAKRRGGYI